MVDPVTSQLAHGDGDVLCRAVLARVHGALHASPARGGVGLGEGPVVGAALHRVGAHADQQVPVLGGGELGHVQGVAPALLLDEVQDHAAADAQVGPGVDHPGGHSGPHRRHVHPEEAGREEHLPIADPGRHCVLQALIGDTAEVVCGLQALADHGVDVEELVEAGELVQVGRVGHRELHPVGAGQIGDGGGPTGPLHMAVQFHLGEPPQVLFGGGGHGSSSSPVSPLIVSAGRPATVPYFIPRPRSHFR